VIGLLKIAGASAVLSVGLVNAFPDAPTGPKYPDRLPQTSAEAAHDGCAAQVWPSIPRTCLIAVDGAPIRAPVRTVTVEIRAGANTSALMRVQAPAAAR
jgi:hypothetical protein